MAADSMEAPGARCVPFLTSQVTSRTVPFLLIHRPEAFAIFVGVIVAIAAGMVWWFLRRGWLGSRWR
jgi:hypothetical protein